MVKKRRIGFFKRFKMAIFELENYTEFVYEKLSKAIGFCFKMTMLLSLLVAVGCILFIYAKFDSPAKYVDYIIPEFTYNNGDMIIDEEDAKKDEKKFAADVMHKLDLTYDEILQNGNYDKNDLINYVSSNERNIVIIAMIAIFIENVIDTFTFWLIMGLLTSFIGWVVFKFSRIKMKYSKLYALSLYASTLSIMLTVIYTMLNMFFAIYIELFDYLSMLIAYIYITAVIYIIKSELIKQQFELIAIANAQSQIKEQLDKEEEKTEEKENKEKDDSKNNTESNEKKDLDDEPDGSEI